MLPEFSPRDLAALLDIVAAAARIRRFLSDVNREEFANDEKTQSAVLHQLLIVGEAAKRLSRSARASLSEVPWKQVTGMRDHLIHAYDAVDIEEVWRTASTDVPSLNSQLLPLVEDNWDPADENSQPQG